MQIAFLKFIDNYLGRFVCRILRPLTICQNIVPVRFLIIRPGGIGDAVLLVPSINVIKKSYPNSHITILTERRSCEVFSMMPQVDKFFCYDRPKEFAKALLGKFDVVIDTEQWYRLSAVVARMVRSSLKIGFGTNERRRMFTHVIDYDQAAHEFDNFASLLKPFMEDSRLLDFKECLILQPLLPSKIIILENYIKNQPFAVLLPGASVREKCWGKEKYRAVAEDLQRIGFKVVVVGGQEDQSDCEYISSGLGLNLAGITTLSETASVIDQSDLLISGDSGILHIAACLDIPTVSIFGPSSIEKWAPRGEKHITVSHQLNCSPCSSYGTIPPCSHNVRCMKTITAAQVVEAAVTLLKRTAKS